MAKKKTENIKAGPVLRAQSEDPTPEQTGTRTYQIMDPWKDRDVVNLVDVKAVDGEITEVKVNGEPAGGGSGGDFSTAEVTFVDPNSEGYGVYAPFVLDANEYPEHGGPLPTQATPTDGVYCNFYTDTFTDPVRVALYKGVAYVKVSGAPQSVSGSAELVGNVVVKVTGNCTITIS